MTVSLVYEGRLGSNRADSTYVLENAQIYGEMTPTRIIVSRRHKWKISDQLKKKFSIIELGNVFNPKSILQSILGQLKFGLALQRFAKASGGGFEVFIFHDWWPTQLFRFLKPTRQKIIKVLEVHNQLPLSLFWRLSFRHIDVLVATNTLKYEELKPFFSAKLVLEKNCVRLNRYTDESLSKIRVSEIFAYEANQTYVGYTGSLGPEKNPLLFLQVVKSMRSIVFLYAGNMPKVYEDEARTLSNLIMLGPVTPSLIPKLQSVCHLLLVTLDPSNINSFKYTSTMKLLEYIAAKRPIVAPRLPSILDLLDESEFYSYEANSVEDCVSAIKEALESDVGSRRLPRAERFDQYSWEKRNERILNFIEDKFA